MIYDYKNREIHFENPKEETDYKAHMAEYGPGTGKTHPDDCPYCAVRGWKTFPGTTFEAECDKWAVEHPNEVAEADE